MTRAAWRGGVCAIGAVLGLVACGDDGPSVDVDGSNMCNEAAEVLCYDLYRCCTEDEIQQRLGVEDARTEAQCRADLTRACERGIATVQWSIDEGRAELDAATLDACLTALIAPADTCVAIASVAPWAEACAESAFTGTVAVGGDCYYDHECAGDGSYCAADRTCQMLPGDGELCGSSGCAPAMYCDGVVCAPWLDEGDQCTASNQCDDGLFCDLGAAAPSCTVLVEAGDTCGGVGQCVTGATCLASICDNGSGCFTDADCLGSCADDASACMEDGDCRNGVCSTAGSFCRDNFDCTTPETCLFPVPCMPGSCQGEPVCAANLESYDYCQDAPGSSPL